MSRPLNLARQPFRNERLPTLLLAVGCAVLVGVTAHHALTARGLLPERTAGVDGELVSLEREVAELRRESSELGGRSASAEQLQEWAAVRSLVDRRVFSWSALFGSLEEVLPPDVRLVSVAPGEHGKAVELRIRAEGRTVDAGHELFEVLQGRAEFKEPFLQSVSETDEGVAFDFTMGYMPAAEAGEGAS